MSVVVPTLGRSPWLLPCLAALRRQDGGERIEILVVDQGALPAALPEGLADRVLRPERNLGFTGGTNLGIAAARGALVATVNDDAIAGPGWLGILCAALRADPAAAAVQGLNLRLPAAGAESARDGALAPIQGAAGLLIEGAGAPVESTEVAKESAGAPVERTGVPVESSGVPVESAGAPIDGCGLGWNGWWQAVQLGHDTPAPPAAPDGLPGSAPGSPPAVVEVFGVSATAAIYRRAALRAVAGSGGEVFDPRLVSYYEDAELAGRLRAAGYRALVAPAARAWHAGSASAPAAGGDRWRLIYGNRYLAAARLLGRAFWVRLPRMVLRDLIDLAHLVGGEGSPAGAGDEGPGSAGGGKPRGGGGGPDGALYGRPGGAGDRRPGGAGDGRPESAGGGRPGGTAGGRPEGAGDGRTERQARARRARMAGILAGWWRAVRLLPAYAHGGPPALPPAEIGRLSRLDSAAPVTTAAPMAAAVPAAAPVPAAGSVTPESGDRQHAQGAPPTRS